MSPLPPPSDTLVRTLPKEIVLYGPPGGGKSVLGATWDPNFPASGLPAPRKPADTGPLINLDSTFSLLWDGADGLAGLAEAGIVCPHWDLKNIEPLELPKFLPEIRKVVAERVKSGQTKTLIIDTLSSFNTKLVAYCSTLVEGAPEADKGDVRDGSSQRLYRLVLKIHVGMHQFFSSLPGCTVINLCHAVAKFGAPPSKADDAVKHATLKRESEGLAGEAVVPEITGQAFDHYMRNATLNGFVSCKYVNGSWKRDVVFRSYDGGKMVKCRYASLRDSEPAHFGPIKNKILGLV